MGKLFSHAKKILFALFFIVITSCSGSFEEHQTSHIKEMNKTLLAAAKESARQEEKKAENSSNTITDILAEEGLQKFQKHQYVQSTYSVNLNKAPADNFFATLADMYDQSIVISPDVQGEITLNMKDVTIEDILKAVRRIYGFEFEQTPYGYNIFMPRLETRIFMIDRLDIERTGTSSMSVSSNSKSGGSHAGSGSKGSGSTSVSTEVKTDFWANLKETIEAIIETESLATRMNQGRRTSGSQKTKGHVVINKDSGLVVVRAYPQQLRQVEAYIAKTQKTLQRQVIIEAKILDVELNDQHASGIDWNMLGSTVLDGKRYDIQFNNGSSGSANPLANSGSKLMKLGLTRSKNGFQSILNILGGHGKLSVLSSPRISTLNNQKAVIKVGKDAFYSTSVDGSSSNIAGGTVTNTSRVNLQSFFSGIALDVTPQISDDEQITLHIHPVITQVTSGEQVVTVGDKSTTLHAPSTRTRETDTIVRAKNGQVIIIGGLMESDVNNQDSIPQLSDKLGVIKDLMTHKNHQKTNKELIILLKPVIVEEGTWEKELRKAAAASFKEQKI